MERKTILDTMKNMGKNMKIGNCIINARLIVQYSLNVKFRGKKLRAEVENSVFTCIPGKNVENGAKTSRD